MNNSIFDLPSKKVHGNKEAIEYLIKVTQNLLEKNFPPSFIAWLKEYGQEASINKGSGNFLTNMLLPQKEGDEIISVSDGAEYLEKAGWPITKDFISFGSDGGENNFVLYTKFSKNKEFPVLMVSLDDKDHPYVLMATSFSGFVNTYVKFEILRPDVQDEKKQVEIAKELLHKHEPRLHHDFAEQLASWEWKFSSLKEIESKLTGLGFSNKQETFKFVEFDK